MQCEDMSVSIPYNQRTQSISLSGNSVMVTSCYLPQQYSPVISCLRDNGREELFMLEQDAENHSYSRDNGRELFVLKQDFEMESEYHEIKSDQLISHSEEQPSQKVVSEEHFTTSRLDELVVDKHHNWILPSDNDNTTVCRYCREEVMNCYYANHLVRCSGCRIGYNCWKSNQLLTCYENNQETAMKQSSEEEETKEKDYNYIINCIAVQASE